MLKTGANSVTSAPVGSPHSSQGEHPLSVAAHLRELQWTSWALCQLLSLVRSISWLLETTSRNGQKCFLFQIKKQRRLQKGWWMRSFPGKEHLNGSTLTRVTALKPSFLRRWAPSSVLTRPGQHCTTPKVMAWLSGWTVYYRTCWPSTSLSTSATRCSPTFGYDGAQVQHPLIDSIYAALSFVWSWGQTTLRCHVWSQAILAGSSLWIC